MNLNFAGFGAMVDGECLHLSMSRLDNEHGNDVGGMLLLLVVVGFLPLLLATTIARAAACRVLPSAQQPDLPNDCVGVPGHMSLRGLGR